ncbi:excalibur calcium-binding domain-containing protein [Propionibacterium freudenreichii]|nr:excalibur calcium-binding domain-containing protein [Propionibacterium freudenreichii]MDK9324781.1 excalibur calcium-binding domain-containing protein [Propionibacterium freudenreichii]MDK9341105.1 excalibur calcium-binding domain-containing protein [Propionibacterium freudenreichii]
MRTSILRETSTPTRPPTRSTRYTLVREEPSNLDKDGDGVACE